MIHERTVLRLMAHSHHMAGRAYAAIGYMMRLPCPAARGDYVGHAVASGLVAADQIPLLAEAAAGEMAPY